MSRAEFKPGVRPSIALPLEAGDRLSRDEFERRYDATPGIKKAELIEGVVYMPPPVSHSGHSTPHANLVGMLFSYSIATPGTIVGDNGSLRLDLDNMPQPDAYMMIAPDCGGQSRISEDDYVTGAPELVAEIASSSVSYDLHAKLNIYRRNGVREYIVWRTQDKQIDQFVLHQGEYQAIAPDTLGILQSRVFPGLWLDAFALANGRLRDAVAVLQLGLASSEHGEFAQKLDRPTA